MSSPKMALQRDAQARMELRSKIDALKNNKGEAKTGRGEGSRQAMTHTGRAGAGMRGNGRGRGRGWAGMVRKFWDGIGYERVHRWDR